MLVGDRGHTSVSLIFATENEMARQAYAMNYREEARLLGGSASDWLVLVGGVLLAGLFAAVFVL